MTDPTPDLETSSRSEQPPDFKREVLRQVRRKQVAAQQPARSPLLGLGMFGVIGWSVALPTLMGIAVGSWLDRRWPGTVSWTLTAMLVGLLIGCGLAWHWVSADPATFDGDVESTEDEDD